MTQGRVRGRFGAPLVALVTVTLVAVMGIVGTASAKPVGGAEVGARREQHARRQRLA